MGGAFEKVCNGELKIIAAGKDELSREHAVKSYVFNSQIITMPDGSMAIIAPQESYENIAARRFIERVIAEDNPISSVHYVNLRQSMANGGGPACLRLRVVLTETELSKVHQGVMLNEQLYGKLVEWVKKNYRENLSPEDLRDPNLAKEAMAANAEVT